jgi:outer membrane receptor protein involved in Fe transport
VGGWISGQIYHDVYIGYRVGKGARTDAWWNRALANSSIRLGVNNVFDHIPPYDNSGGIPGYPVLYSAYGDIRLATYIISVKKGF